MNIEKTSAEFEAWFKERFWHECYEDVKHHLFAAWQASRESRVIDLGKPDVEEWSEAFITVHYGWSKEAIEAAGLKVK